MQQSGFNDMQLLQQNLIYKQIQELQRQQQLQHLGDNRLQNSFSQPAKQNPGAQFSPLINGVPVNDEQNMLRSRMQIMESATSRGSFDRSMLLQEQNSSLRSMNSSPQQFDTSLCGTPISEPRGGMNALWNVQGSPDSMNIFSKCESKGLMLGSGMNNLYPEEQSTMQLELGMPDEGFASKQVFPEKGLSNDFQMRGQGSFFTRNFQEDNSLQGNDALPEFSGRQGEIGWHETKNSGPYQEMVPLDPLEAKILYNADCSIWEAFGDPSTLAAESFGNAFGHTGSPVPIQSGSWSALMQSAVAEASSMENSPQERWSGLNNTETLNGCQTSNTVASGKHKSEWEVSNNLKPMSTMNDMSSFFPGFHSQDDENQKVQAPLHQGNSWATQTFPNDIPNKKNASSAFMKFEKGLQENIEKFRSEKFHNSSDVGNEGLRKRKEIYQTDSSITKVSDQESSHLEQMKRFGNHPNSIGELDKSPANLAGDMRGSRDIFSSPQSNIGNQNRSMMSEAHVDDPAANPLSRFSNQSPNYSHGPGLNLSPSLHKQPYFKRSPSATPNMEGANSLPREQWNEVLSSAANLGSSSQWKSVPSAKDSSGPSILPSSDKRQYNIPHYNSEDSFPILEASTVRHPHFLPPSSHQNENPLSPLSLWRTKSLQQPNNTEPTKPSQQFPSLPPFKGKSDSSVLAKNEFPGPLQKDEMMQKQEMESFTFQPVTRPPPLPSLDKISQEKQLPDNVPRFSNAAEYGSNAKCESSQAVDHILPALSNEDNSAPTLPWLMQYGSKNGHVLHTLDPKSSAAPPRFADATLERPSTTPNDDSAPTSHVASASVLPLDLIEEGPVHPKKRKLEPPSRLPWRLEITQESSRIPSLSVAEDNWSRAANRSFEKVENATSIYDDVAAHKRSKQRLTLTTQLTQLLFPPLAEPWLSSDSGSDALTYVAARGSVGESCSVSCWKESKSSTEAEEARPERKKRVEESLGRVLSRLKRVESEFQRVERAGTVADLRTEVQEVEKFAVINRFAKFHGRGPAEVGVGRPNLLRYVTAFPLPSALPQGVHCLPL